MSKVIAAYGGGFKPPTKGHFEVVQKALNQNPKIDEFIIYVGSGERGGLNQAQSILIWEIYQTYLPMKVKIEPSKSPIGDIIRLGKNNLQDEVYFVLGAREGFEDDMKDIESRTKNIEEKYPNMKIKIITTPNKGISGTNARKASQVSYDDFIKYIPSELSDSEKEEVYNIIKPSISETNNPEDGKAAPYGSGYNELNEDITQSQLNALEAYADNLFAKLGIDIEFTRHFLDRVNDERNIKPISIPELIGMFKRLYKKHGKPLSKIDNDFDAVVKDFNSNINIPFAINVTPEDIELVAKTVMRKKDFKTSTPVIALEENSLFNLDIPKFNYKRTLSERLWQTLNEISLSKENAVEVNGDLIGGNFTVGNIIYEYNIKNISNPYEGLGLFYNIQFTPKEEITSIPQMGKENYIKILSTMYKIIVDFIEKEKPEYVGISSLDNNGKNYHKVYANLTDNKSNNIPGYFRKDVNLEFTTPEGKGKFIVLKRRENLNENASYSQDIDIKSKIMQLTQHMLDKGMNIEPLPKVEFVDGDSDNAREFLGKTAYYNPNNNTIVLYTEGRHPKDITRSFSHEMIHHIQNLEGRLGDITTTNTQEDDHLNNIEAEANLKGTMTFRNWTDSLNENISTQSFPNSAFLFGGFFTGVQGMGIGKAVIQDLFKNNPKIENLLLYTQDDAIGFWKKLGGKVIQQGEDKKGTLRYFVQINKNDVDTNSNMKQLGISYKNLSTKKSKIDKGEYVIKMGRQKIGFFFVRDVGTIEMNPMNIIINNLNEANKPYKHKHGFDDKLGKDPFGLNQFAREVAEGVLNEGRYDKLANRLSKIAFETFKNTHDKGDKEGEFEFRVDHPDDEHDIPSKDFSFDFIGKVEITDDEYGVDGGANAGFDNEGEEIIPLLSVKFKIPKNPDWQKISFDIKDVIRHELEHLTQDGGNLKPGKYIEDDQLVRDLINIKMLPKSQYFKLEGEIDAMLQGMYFKSKKAKQPFGKTLNNYLDIFVDGGEITPEEKEDILKVWRSRGKALSLPLFEQTKEQMNYTIYSDMDGVLTDFDARFMKASEGIIPSEYKRNFGTNGFWDLIEKGGVRYWAGMPWMSDGKKYWDYIKKYNPLLLSSPSASESSRLGKRVWVKNNLPGTKLILARSTDKQKYADENSILIDDRPSNIDQWRSQGGIGILHVSAEDTIQQLKKLGL